MKIHIDGDACPVKVQVIKLAKKYTVDVNVFMDVNHIYVSEDVTVITCDQGQDSVDMAIVNQMSQGDIVITNDYGLAALALGKKGYVMNGHGKEYTAHNIDLLLFERHMHKEIRMSKKRHKGPKKRSKEANGQFTVEFEALLKRMTLTDN